LRIPKGRYLVTVVAFDVRAARQRVAHTHIRLR